MHSELLWSDKHWICEHKKSENVAQLTFFHEKRPQKVSFHEQLELPGMVWLLPGLAVQGGPHLHLPLLPRPTYRWSAQVIPFSTLPSPPSTYWLYLFVIFVQLDSWHVLGQYSFCLNPLSCHQWLWTTCLVLKCNKLELSLPSCGCFFSIRFHNPCILPSCIFCVWTDLTP